MIPRNADMRVLADRISEASFKDRVSHVKNQVAAELGNHEAKGKVQQAELAKKFKSEFKTYLGRTGKQADEATLMQFLIAQIGFTATNARELFKQAGMQDPIVKTESIIMELDGSQMDKLFQVAAQFAFTHNLVDTDKDSKGRRSYSGRGGYGGYGDGYGYRRRGYGNEMDGISDIAAGAGPEDPAKVAQRKADDKKKAADAKAAGKAPAGDASTTGGLDKAKMKGIVNKLGLDDSDIEDLNFSVNQDDYHTLVNSGDTSVSKQLAILGYAYLKANGK
jgi:hypothetical protein